MAERAQSLNTLHFQAVELRAKGLGCRRISVTLGVHKNTVLNWMRREDFQQKVEERKEELRAMEKANTDDAVQLLIGKAMANVDSAMGTKVTAKNGDMEIVGADPKAALEWTNTLGKLMDMQAKHVHRLAQLNTSSDPVEGKGVALPTAAELREARRLAHQLDVEDGDELDEDDDVLS